MRRDLTTRSVILEMRDRFEIGRQLVSSSLSNVGFLSSGEITDYLRVGLNSWEVRERLTILVIVGRSTDEHSLRARWGLDLNQIAFLDSWTGSCGLRIAVNGSRTEKLRHRQGTRSCWSHYRECWSGRSGTTEGKRAKICPFHIFIATHQDYGLRQEFLSWLKLLTNPSEIIKQP